MNTQKITSDATRAACGAVDPATIPRPQGYKGHRGDPGAPEELPEDLTVTEDGRAKQVAPPVMMDDAGDDAELNETRSAEVEKAFAVKPFFWRDIKLAPFAIDREGDWLQHRELLDAPPLGEVMRRSSAMALDAMRVLWFLAHDPAEWLNMPGSKWIEDEQDKDKGRWVRLSGKERAMELESKIRAWGAENVTSQEGTDMVALFYDIYMSAHSTRATAKPSEHRNDDRAKN